MSEAHYKGTVCNARIKNVLPKLIAEAYVQYIIQTIECPQKLIH